MGQHLVGAVADKNLITVKLIVVGNGLLELIRIWRRIESQIAVDRCFHCLQHQWRWPVGVLVGI